MKRFLGKVLEGDALSAGHYNKLTGAAQGLEMAGPPAGQAGVSTGGMSGTTFGEVQIKMVRIIHPVISDASDQFDANDNQNPDQAKYNAAVQVYDSYTKTWVDEPGGEKISVSLGDDAVGWRPLERYRRFPVQWTNEPGRWVPLETTEASVVMITSNTADADGFKPGVRFVYDSDNLAWVVADEILIIDVGG